MQREYLFYDGYEVDYTNMVNVVKNKSISSRDGITGCFDWLSCTFDCFTYEPSTDFSVALLDSVSEHKIQTLLSFFGKNGKKTSDFTRETAPAGFKYKITLQEGCYLLFYGNKTSNGLSSTALNISGQGCSWLIHHHQFYNLLKYCRNNGYKFTRFDSAIDNFTRIMPLSHIIKLIKKNAYTSAFVKGFDVRGTPNEKSEYLYDSFTAYLGTDADMLIRIYAKNWKEGVQDKIKDWVRWEIQIRDHERIKQLVSLIILGYEEGDYSDYFNIVASLLKGVLMFRVPGKNKQKTRWKEDPEYLKFLNGINEIKLFHAPKSKSNFETSKAWFERSCTLFLTQVFMVYGREKFERYIKYLITDRAEDMQENDFNMVINACESENKVFDKQKTYQELLAMRKEFNRYEFDKSLTWTDEEEEELKKRKEEETEEE